MPSRHEVRRAELMLEATNRRDLIAGVLKTSFPDLCSTVELMLEATVDQALRGTFQNYVFRINVYKDESRAALVVSVRAELTDSILIISGRIRTVLRREGIL